jgi:hypothetical protein
MSNTFYYPAGAEVLPGTVRYKFRHRIQSTSGNEYVIAYDAAEGSRYWTCSCRGNVTHGHCKHLVASGVSGRKFGPTEMPFGSISGRIAKPISTKPVPKNRPYPYDFGPPMEVEASQYGTDRLGAIKEYRKRTGASLAEAKAAFGWNCPLPPLSEITAAKKAQEEKERKEAEVAQNQQKAAVESFLAAASQEELEAFREVQAVEELHQALGVD